MGYIHMEAWRRAPSRPIIRSYVSHGVKGQLVYDSTRGVCVICVYYFGPCTLT